MKKIMYLVLSIMCFGMQAAFGSETATVGGRQYPLWYTLEGKAIFNLMTAQPIQAEGEDHNREEAAGDVTTAQPADQRLQSDHRTVIMERDAAIELRDAALKERDDLLQARKNQHRAVACVFGIGSGLFAANAFQFAPCYKNVDPKAVMAVGGVVTGAVVTPTIAWYLSTHDYYATKYKAPEVIQESKKRLPWKSVAWSIVLLGGTGLAGDRVAKYYNCNQNETVAATLAGPATLLVAAGYVHAKKHRALKKAAREQAVRDGRI